MHTPLRFSTPPRRVPLSLAIGCVLGGVSQVGWLLAGFGSIFFWVFVANADLSFIDFRGPLQSARGEIVRVEETSATENKRRVYANYYTYSVAGQRLEGISYNTGDLASAGTRVAVEYDPADPSRSRVAGMRRAMFGPFVLFVMIFPLIGLAIALGAMLSGSKRIRLLREGLLAMGTLKDKQPTNMTVNKRPVWELVFEFQDRSGRKHEAIARTSLTEKLEDEKQEPLLYDPQEPERAFLLDDAPARPRLQLNGELVGSPAALLRLAVPAVVIAANAAIIYLKL